MIIVLLLSFVIMGRAIFFDLSPVLLDYCVTDYDYE